MPLKVTVVTLGCDKNTVDSERYLAELVAHGAEQAAAPEQADVVIVNTCGFIDAAKRESIDAIVEAGRLRRAGSCRALVAIGCMVERHREELREALPEVDVLLGTSDADRLVEELHARGLVDSDVLAHPGVRLFAGELPHVRYLKVSEGCDHGCAFCAIPLMRGRHRSFPADQLVREAQLLELQGAQEVNLVAQDLAHYGRDLRNGTDVAGLLGRLTRETGVPWIRLLYLYSAGITSRLLETVAAEPRVLPYLDMPMQHASDTVLARMRRPERKRTLREKIARYRDAVPDVVIRTTCIVGFPGETDRDYEELLEFLQELRFDRVGAFTYSPQEGTRAAELPDDVPEPLKRERLERLTELQRGITAERNEQRCGRSAQAIVDRVSADGTVGRVWWQAHDIDGITSFDCGSRTADLLRTADEPPKPGSIVEVTVDHVVDDYDLSATLVRSLAARTRALSTPLPVIEDIARFSYGR